jgi:hypothetical protein
MLRRHLLTQLALLVSLAALPAAAQPAPPSQGSAPPAYSAESGAHVHRFIERFRAANTTGDGRLMLAQAQAGYLPMIMRNFDAIDAQHKGYVTLQDVRAWRQQMRGNRAPQGHRSK